MKWHINPRMLSLAILLPLNQLLSQKLYRFTTTELLSQAKANGSSFINGYFLNYALPLIDTEVAVQMARIAGAEGPNKYTDMITLQCRDDSLRQFLLNNLLAHDKLCDAPMVAKPAYDQSMSGVYEYWPITNEILTQVEGDTSFIATATKEFNFWGPMAWGYMDTIMRSGAQQFAIKSGKRKFSPCLLASYGNSTLWASCIYFITGKDEYGSSNDHLNEIYKKVIKVGVRRKNHEEKKGIVQLVKKDIASTTTVVNTIDSLDFDSIPLIKEKLEEVRKNHNWQIIIYTHGNKGLLFLYYEEKMMMELSRQWVGIPATYLVELTSPSTIDFTSIKYRDRY